MSFTAVYTELRAIRDGEVCERRLPPRITDPEGFDSVPQSVDIGADTFERITVTGEEVDHGDYPTQTWQTLKGFKSWTPRHAFGLDHDPSIEDLVGKIESHRDHRSGPLGYTYNIERVGIPYGGWDGEWRRLFSEVSKYTEPFAFYHSPHEHEFPDVTDFRDGGAEVYYVESHDGDLYAETHHFERVSCEPEIQEAEKVGSHVGCSRGGDA